MKRTSSHWVHNNQALWEIWNMTLTSHSCPANSGGHWHTNPSNTAWHWPPFWHGLLSHLSLWISQRAPTNPGGHRRWGPPGTSYRKHEKGKWWERGKPFFFFLVKVCAAMLSAKQPVEARTLHVAPFWHWPWQPLLPEEEEELIIKRNVRLFPRSSSLWGHFSGAVYTLGCAQIRSKFGKETSGAKRVPDKPLIDCDWACTGSGERYWHASSVMMAQLPAEFCQEEKETGYHMWEKWVKTNYT